MFHGPQGELSLSVFRGVGLGIICCLCLSLGMSDEVETEVSIQDSMAWRRMGEVGAGKMDLSKHTVGESPNGSSDYLRGLCEP